MITAAICFYLFAGVLLVSAVLVITARNPVHSVLWLILAFFNAAGLFLLLGAEFLAMLLVIVYVGAVAVLFLFVVMMLDIDFGTLRGQMGRYLPLGLIVAGIILAEILAATTTGWVTGAGVNLADATLAPPPPGMTNTQWIGAELYTRYVFIFSQAGMVLLVSMIGAIVLTYRQRVGVKRQNVTAQVARTPANAVRVQPVAIGQGVEL